MRRILGIAMVLGLVAFIAGCSKEKVPQIKAESASEKFETASNDRGITKEPTKKESSGKEEVIELGKDVKLEMVLIPAGKFLMGGPRKNYEVTLTKPFYIGKYEVTQEQWEGVMGKNPSNTKGAKLPVTNVSWNDCHFFIRKLNDNTKGGYRLPTEAEWEYSCRAGTTKEYSFGDKITPKDANYKESKIGKSVAVGSYKPNAFGLYDMHGNVFECCEDWYGNYPAGAVIDPKGPATGKYRVLRGGSFLVTESGARSSGRGYNSPTDRLYDGLGFRLARTP